MFEFGRIPQKNEHGFYNINARYSSSDKKCVAHIPNPVASAKILPSSATDTFTSIVCLSRKLAQVKEVSATRVTLGKLP